ncbi:nucleotidyltransferase domain-containing protein [Archaeoglobus veneficus]|uniref:DNA polymerase beta domain protein region n=1 Tax=Archaeoglobus veneficus (strain DSM 11195 / SNP6) TaxID=693661 RepID=F2KRW5_ARCVS|nr:nucleotidyltransferase domain-containing protein [Archaeoglobus veneficus]AEA46806.1 DNA polymerase beta domain protein region [Archaeoglobus veneficus SNP6]
MNLMDAVREIAQEERKYFENYMEYAQKIKKVAEGSLGKADVYVFGSVVEGRHTPASDIDILIVSENTPKSQWERGRIRAKIMKAIDVFAPFEIHIVTPKEFEWYRRFIQKMRKV